MNVGKVVIIIGLSSKPRDIALPIRDIISNNRAREMPKNIRQTKFYKRRGEINTRISVSIFRNNY
jgi:hypothetical protein